MFATASPSHWAVVHPGRAPKCIAGHHATPVVAFSRCIPLAATPGSLGKWIGARSADADHALSANCQSSGFAYPSMRYTERLADAGIAPSVGAKAMPTPMPSPSRSLVSSRRR